MLLAGTAIAGTRAAWATEQQTGRGSRAHRARRHMSGRLQNNLIRAPPLTSAERLPAAPNGGSARVISGSISHSA
jgi:hypothetical protein